MIWRSSAAAVAVAIAAVALRVVDVFRRREACANSYPGCLCYLVGPCCLCSCYLSADCTHCDISSFHS